MTKGNVIPSVKSGYRGRSNAINLNFRCIKGAYQISLCKTHYCELGNMTKIAWFILSVRL